MSAALAETHSRRTSPSRRPPGRLVGGVLVVLLSLLLLGVLPPTAEAGEIIPLCSGSGCGWKVSEIPTNVSSQGIVLDDVFDIQNHVVAVGQEGTILLSGNNGESFIQIPSPPGTPDLNVLAEDKDGVLWAGGNDATLEISQDAGQSWTTVTATGLQGNISVLGFPSASFAYAATDHGLYFSNDGGTSWSLDSGLGDGWVRAAAFINATTGWVDFGLSPSVEFTTDGGRHWVVSDPPDAPYIATGLYALGGESAYYLSRDGALYNTINGTGWARDNSPLGQVEQSLDVVNRSSLWEVGLDGNIYYHPAGAGCWLQEPVPGVPDFYGVAFTDTNHGVVVGAGTAYYTSDGGTGITVNYTSPISIVGGGGNKLLPNLIPGDPDDQGPPGPCGTRPSYAPYILGTAVGIGLGVAVMVGLVAPQIQARRARAALPKVETEAVRQVEKKVRYRNRKKRYIRP